MADTEEKLERLNTGGQPQSTLTPVSSYQGRPLSTVRSMRSYVDGHGTYQREQETEDVSAAEKNEVDVEGSPEKAFEVRWDGPDDPMNPKNLATARKWLIVITLAFGSLCVTCTSSLYTITYGKLVGIWLSIVCLKLILRQRR